MTAPACVSADRFRQDDDNHVLEVAEKMEVVIYRLLQIGNSIEEIAKLTGYPMDQVLREIDKHTRGN